MNDCRRFLYDQAGATAIEYGLIAVIVSIAIFAGAYAIGQNLTNGFQRVVAGFGL